ncbi:MAG: 3-hydroxyacyl-CoA dehydrogenase [fadN-fadA-fadE operon] / Enoyl-CoA hydratase [fadN-fadA-fadE operon] [uncultured Thermomicrobiales bacterium]|uniref:3-hydroxyacyl-CoA dehydrogenase [fadN-fadA-fadE operon] / Enoyl-CoA hydratase [fadN-fadA-fadE operon] n=1 Tax=uncultured Thermomicrobiales bacterium TaxID=1645740 RepID=A0A6J4VF40_9BACT|nr:MAG: 3-hydroxyacyl-CoA dehydrogenase [fadN-fadA-fadE operon] / Enoyl-CoA hydratase [fadN-fadA-fadE operon] [uncultured Thermomicrobiales bacterium]
MAGTIKRVAVLGAGTMGAAIAGHCANAGIPVYLLDIAPRELTPDEEKKGLTLDHPAVRNRIVKAGFDRMVKARPANLFSPRTADLITLGNFEDNFDWVGEADWILEAIVERLEPKQGLMARVEAARKPGSVVSSNTSGIPLHQVAEGRGEDFKQHFLGTHFFNPPRYLKLLEIIPIAETDPAIVARMREFGERTLGKGVVVCKDTPNFIANRFGTFDGMYGARWALENGYAIEEVDALTGPLIGRPSTASFRLSDLAGLDIMVGVAENLYAAAPEDESREEFKTPELLSRMVAEGRLGNKVGQGFYKAVTGPGGRREFHILDPETMEYRPPRKPDLPIIAEAQGIADLGERLRFIMRRADEGDRGAKLIEQLTVPALAYAARRIPEFSDDIVSVDDAIRWGFARKQGPFETWDALGVPETIARMERDAIEVPSWVKAMYDAGYETFYRREGGQLLAYSPLTKSYEPVQRGADLIDLATLKEAGKEIAAKRGASLLDLGDGVLCLEFHAKANAIGKDATDLLAQGLDLLESDDAWRAMVIGNQGDFFAAGVNLTEVGAVAQGQGPVALAAYLEAGHALMQRLRFSPKPVVAAPFGQTLGLGVEISLAAAGICAEGETYMGLVEVGVGLIPGGGGCKELVRRIVSPPMHVPGTNPEPFLRRVFETIGQAKVSTSAIEARDLGFLDEGDRIVLGRDRLIAEAKRMALDLAEAGYRPPVPGRNCYAAAEGALGTLTVGIHQFKVGGYISDYDAEIARALARILCGGDLSAPQWVDEEYLLSLERETFLKLLANPKTQERIGHMLQTGKPLRN